MSDLERAKLIPVSGNNDAPDMGNAIDVQFNPLTLKVGLANTLKANTGQGNSRATQFVDKSSSTLTVELIFDTTYIEAPSANGQGGAGGGSRDRIEQGSDVRAQTRKIADKFIKPVASGSQMLAPSRVLFQWGSFEFVGMLQSFDETLDFFSPKGRPLRSTVSLKLSEDRYQFRSNDSDARDAGQTPTLSFTGNGAGVKDPGGGSDAGNGAPASSQQVSPVPGASRDGAASWRDNALFNGVESPRLPTVAALAMPAAGPNAPGGFAVSGGVGIGVATGIGGGGSGPSAGGSTGAKSPAGGPATASATTPAFKYGNSAALGTAIPGAFSPTPGAGLKASSLQQGSLRLRTQTSGGSGADRPTSRAGAATGASSGTRPAGSHGVSVAALLKNRADSGVGFD